jgi:hypothetical protein
MGPSPQIIFKLSTIHLHSKFQVGQVGARIFGGFLDHLGAGGLG